MLPKPAGVARGPTSISAMKTAAPVDEDHDTPEPDNKKPKLAAAE